MGLLACTAAIFIGGVTATAGEPKEKVSGEVKSQPVPGSKVVNGNFQKRGKAITDCNIPEGSVFSPSFAAHANKGPRKPQFFSVVGKNAGYADDSAGVIVGGNGCMIFSVRSIQPGQKYRVSARAKVAGSGTPVLKIYWSSKQAKGPFDYKMGIPTFAFSEEGENNWRLAEGEITVPEGATKFALIPTAQGIKGETDRIFFDDIEAVLVSDVEGEKSN